MKKSNMPSPLRPADYEAIEAAMLETERGRWFLSEYAKRNRNSDTSVLLEAISKLENTIVKQPQQAAPIDSNVDQLRMNVIDMAKAIADTRREISAMKPDEGHDNQFFDATEELDTIIRATEKATNEILEAAEEIQETAWVLRENGSETNACDRLDTRATDIYTACSFQDLTGQRTGKVIETLRFIEQRVNSMVDIWDLSGGTSDSPEHTSQEKRPDAHLLNGPQLEGLALEQNDVDAMMHHQKPHVAEEYQLKTLPEEAQPNAPQDSATPQIASEDDLSDETQRQSTAVAAGTLENIAHSAEEESEEVKEANSALSDPLLVYDEPSSEQDTTSETKTGTTIKDDPDNLLDDELTHDGNTSKSGQDLDATSAKPDPDVIKASDVDNEEPLTLSTMSTNTRAVLFC